MPFFCRSRHWRQPRLAYIFFGQKDEARGQRCTMALLMPLSPSEAFKHLEQGRAKSFCAIIKFRCALMSFVPMPAFFMIFKAWAEFSACIVAMIKRPLRAPRQMDLMSSWLKIASMPIISLSSLSIFSKAPVAPS